VAHEHNALYPLLVDLRLALLFHPLENPNKILKCAASQMLVYRMHPAPVCKPIYQTILGMKAPWLAFRKAFQEAGLL
jgi:hypothetical protein